MKTQPNRSDRQPRLSNPAFSLIEILVAVALLSFIVLGLLAMFHQTQRAFRSSITQTDVLEGGRAVTELVVRDFEQMAPSHAPLTVNFFADLTPGLTVPLKQNLPGSPAQRTNLVQRFFILTEQNRQWKGVGYQVIPSSTNSWVGTLYRFEASTAMPSGDVLASNFLHWSQIAYQRSLQSIPLTNMPGVERIMDGVIHCRTRVFATNGFPITLFGFQTNLMSTNFFGIRHTGVGVALPSDLHPAQVFFQSNALPGYVELELGILEPRVYERYKAMGTPAAQQNYLQEYSGSVHLFRQMIPIRNVDFSAYK